MIFFCGLGCWNRQMASGVSVIRACLNYCDGTSWCRITSKQKESQGRKPSLRTRKRVKPPNHVRIVQAGPTGPAGADK